MTAREALETEIRSLCGEAVGSLRLLSESVGPLTKSRARHLIMEAEHALRAAAALADQLP